MKGADETKRTKGNETTDNKDKKEENIDETARSMRHPNTVRRDET